MNATERSHLAKRRYTNRIPGRNLFFKPELDNGKIVIVTPRGEQVASIWWRPSQASAWRSSTPSF